MKVLVVTAMYPTYDRPAAGIFVKEQVDSLREAGVDIDVFAFEGKYGARSYLEAVIPLQRILRENSYDIIHAHYGLTGMVARMQLRCPLVVTFHGSDLLGEIYSKYQYTFAGTVKTIISRCAGWFATKCILVADILKPKLKFVSTVTIPMGVDLLRFRPMPRNQAREELGLDQDRKFVLFVASPQNYIKRYDIAQEAVHLLQKDNPTIELLPVYGLPHDQIPLYMNAGDVLVLTSMHEGSPCVVKEALACNLPIVSVDVGDVAERIQGITGCYLCERKPEDVASKIRCVLEGSRLTDGREKISDLSLQNVAQKIIYVYQNLL